MKNIITKFSVLIVIVSFVIVYLTGVYSAYVNTSDITHKSFMEYLSNTNPIIMLANFSFGVLFYVCILFFVFIGVEIFGKSKKPKEEKKFDMTKHGDFRRYYDNGQKRNYWVLGYFGGGSVNIAEAYELAKQFSEAINVPINSVHIDEIFKSRRFKGFKFIYSNVENQTPEKDTDAMDNVWSWLSD